MKQIRWKKDILIPTVSLLIICLMTTLILALTNSATAGKIETLQKETAKAAQQAVLPTAATFQEKSVKLSGKTYTYYEGYDAKKELAGYVMSTSANGYGGLISVMTGIGPDGKVTNAQILDLTETAGLGMNATKDSFIGQFKGKSAGITVEKGGAAGGNAINAMTGATITSKAVTKAVNEALDIYNTVKGGENHG